MPRALRRVAYLTAAAFLVAAWAIKDLFDAVIRR